MIDEVIKESFIKWKEEVNVTEKEKCF